MGILGSLQKTLAELGLEEKVPGRPGSTQSTTLGKEMNLDLIMTFVGLWELMEIPGILETGGYLDEDEAENLWSIWSVTPKKAERLLHRYVLRAYLKFCNRPELLN